MVERGGHHFEAMCRPIAQGAVREQAQSRVGRELRRRMEPAPLLIKGCTQLQYRGVHQSTRNWLRNFWRNESTEVLRNPLAFSLNSLPVILPYLRYSLQNAREPRAAPAVIGWKIGSSKEGVPRWRQEYSHGPTPMSSQCNSGRHVNFVDIRALFAVHFDTHETFIHECCDSLITK